MMIWAWKGNGQRGPKFDIFAQFSQEMQFWLVLYGKSYDIMDPIWPMFETQRRAIPQLAEGPGAARAKEK